MLRLACALALALGAAAAEGPGYKPSQRESVALWPLPHSVSNGIVGPDGNTGGTKVWVDSAGFKFSFASKETPSLTAAAKRYTSLIFLHGEPPHPHFSLGPHPPLHCRAAGQLSLRCCDPQGAATRRRRPAPPLRSSGSPAAASPSPPTRRSSPGAWTCALPLCFWNARSR